MKIEKKETIEISMTKEEAMLLYNTIQALHNAWVNGCKPHQKTLMEIFLIPLHKETFK